MNWRGVESDLGRLLGDLLSHFRNPADFQCLAG